MDAREDRHHQDIYTEVTAPWLACLKRKRREPAGQVTEVNGQHHSKVTTNWASYTYEPLRIATQTVERAAAKDNNVDERQGDGANAEAIVTNIYGRTETGMKMTGRGDSVIIL